MKLSPSCLYPLAPLAIACIFCRPCFAQVPAETAALTGSEQGADLPDAPSFSSSQLQSTAPSQSNPNETDAQRKAREEREEAKREVKAEKKQRVVGVLPLFNVVLNGQAVPLTPGQKFDLSFHTIIDPYTVGLAFIVGGGFGELTDSHTGYGHGPEGFFKRVGASYLDNIDGNLIGNALLPVVLHQDPRYYRKGSGSVKSRIVYSALTTFICHGDNGRLQFNTSNVAGNFIAGAISNAYYPANERGVGLTLQNGVTVTLEGMAGAQILEFSPDLTAYLRRRRERKQALRDAAAQSDATPPTPAARNPLPASPAPAANPPH